MENSTKSHVRWLIHKDVPEVMSFDSAFSNAPITEEQLHAMRMARNIIPMVAEDEDGAIVGYMAYELQRQTLHLIRFVYVSNDIADDMLRKAIKKVEPGTRRDAITCAVPVSDTILAEILSRNHFRMMSYIEEYYDDEDAYYMRYQVLPNGSIL